MFTAHGGANETEAKLDTQKGPIGVRTKLNEHFSYQFNVSVILKN